MASISAALGSDGTVTITRIKTGKTYVIRPLEIGIVTKIETWLTQRRLDNLLATWESLVKRGMMTPGEAVTRAEKFTTDAEINGTFTLGSVEMNRVLFDQPTVPTADQLAEKGSVPIANTNLMNKIKLFALMVGCDDDEMLSLFHEHQTELLAKINMVLGVSMPDPKTDGAA